MTVECSNCGAGPEAWAALIFAAVSVIVAVAALAYARRSARAADAGVALAREEVAMSREEHEVWLRRVNARARFELTLRTLRADEDGVVRTEGNAGFLQVEVGLSNVGERAAGRTTLNVLAPNPYLRWCGANGEEIGGVSPPAPTAETLTSPDGRTVESEFLAETLDSVQLRTPEVRYFRLYFTFPEALQAGAEVVIPVRAKASADELPDDEPEAVTEHVVRVRFTPRS